MYLYAAGTSPHTNTFSGKRDQENVPRPIWDVQRQRFALCPLPLTLLWAMLGLI